MALGVAVSLSVASCSSDPSVHRAAVQTTARSATALPGSNVVTTTTTATPSSGGSSGSARVGERQCDGAIYSAPVWQRKASPSALDVGPAQFTSLLDGTQDAQPADSLPDGVALIEKTPLTVGQTNARTIRISATAPNGDARIVYDSPGVDALNQRTYTFGANAVDAVDLDTPVACGLPAGGLVQYNGGFIARAPTCVTLRIEAEGQPVGSATVAMAGGHC